MTDRTKRGLDCIEAALLLGVMGDALLRATPWGINVLLWTLALVLALVTLAARWRGSVLRREGRWLVLPVILFAAAFAWRDSMTLKALDFLLLLVSLALVAWRARAYRVRLAGVMEYALEIAYTGACALFAFFPLVLSDVRWKELPRGGWSRHAWAVLRGLIIAVPLLMVFGLLFMAADAVFEGLVQNTLHINFGNLFTHLFLIILFTWITGGFLRDFVLGKEGSWITAQTPLSLGLDAARSAAASGEVKEGAENNSQPGLSGRLKMGIVEIGVVLGLINLLFLSFVVVQVKYFFGGAALVQASTGLTYAEYARRGFFELVTVAALVLPLLLAAHWLLRKENARHERIFRALAGIQLLLLFVIMASAVGRMRLYQNEYGLTELRIYTTAFMGWLALVFVWFALTVLRGERERFMHGALVAAFLMVGALHLVNPDALIVRVNMEHAQAGRSFDAVYVSSLSADFVPAIFEAFPAMSHYERCVIKASLLRRSRELGTPDWRSWNRSRSVALRLIEENMGGLLEVSCPQTPYPPPVPMINVSPNADAHERR
ncbi:MAG TPA: DUF4173 domain-containing protein [Pyrinomonadaceae bacterium]|jgi:hypothetical protein|nr:DUF4173 domain-containing protein [Pyrinomonadaceae bacterium]